MSKNKKEAEHEEKKATVEAVVEEVEAIEEPAKKDEAPDASFFVYVGPTIQGVIQKGSIFNGDRGAVLAAIDPVVKKFPQIALLIAPGDKVAEFMHKAETPGNLLHDVCKKMLKVKF